MYAISNEYKQIIYSGDAQNKLKLLFNGVEYTNVGRTSETLKVTSKILSNGNTRFSLDNFVSKEAELIIHDIDLEDIKEPINISIGTLVNNAYEYVPIGVFKLDTAPTTDNGKTTIKMRDYSTNFDVPYDASVVIEENGGSATMLQILQDICTKCDIELGTTTFTNMNTEVSVWDNSINARVYIMYIAEKAGCIATMSREGKLILVDLQKGEDIEAEIQNALYINNALARNINLEELQGNTIQDGTPTPDSPVEVQTVTGRQVINERGENLFDKNNPNILNAVISSAGVITSNSRNRSVYVPCKSNTKYSISWLKTSQHQVGTTTEVPAIDGTCLEFTSTITTTTTDKQFFEITTPSEANYIIVRIANINQTSNWQEAINSLIIEEIPDGTTEVPYQGKDYKINLGTIELNKIGTYQDKIYKQNDTWYIEKQIGKVVLDGSENWAKIQIGTTGKYYYQRNPRPVLGQQTANGKLVLSNYFKATNTWSERVVGIWLDVNMIIKTEGSLDGTETVEDFKTWLSTHNTTVYYVLETPTYTEITNEELISQLNALNKAKLNYGVNSITITSNNLNMGLKIAYQSIKEPFELNTRLFEKYKAGEKLEISRVVYEDAIRKFESGTEDKGTLYINTANPYITSQEEIENIYDMINGLAIYSMNISKMRGNPAIDPWDLLKFTYNNQEYIFLGQNVLTFTGNVMQSFDTQIGSNAKTQENVTLNAEASQFKRIFTRIDQAEGNIELNASQISSVQTNLQENYYTLEQTNQLILNAQTGLTNTFSEAGGNNIFRNTGLWFTQSDNNNPYEFWTGVVDKVREEKSASTNALLLQNTTLVQEQDVPNGNYTISFKYKKLIAASLVKCVINDVEYELTQTTDTEFTQSIEVNSQHINIKFISNINNACEIYDLMVNAGTVKLAYSQNQNETTTDTVNISKGITITSSEIDTTFKANADGVRIYDSKDLTNPKTKFTDKGTETDYLKVNNEAEIVNILIQKVGNHTWFTKI